jgi:hypothetical protein
MSPDIILHKHVASTITSSSYLSSVASHSLTFYKLLMRLIPTPPVRTWSYDKECNTYIHRRRYDLSGATLISGMNQTNNRILCVAWPLVSRWHQRLDSHTIQVHIHAVTCTQAHTHGCAHMHQWHDMGAIILTGVRQLYMDNRLVNATNNFRLRQRRCWQRWGRKIGVGWGGGTQEAAAC